MPGGVLIGLSEVGWSLLALHSAAACGPYWPSLREVGLLSFWTELSLARRLGSRSKVATVLNQRALAPPEASVHELPQEGVWHCEQSLARKTPRKVDQRACMAGDGPRG